MKLKIMDWKFKGPDYLGSIVVEDEGLFRKMQDISR